MKCHARLSFSGERRDALTKNAHIVVEDFFRIVFVGRDVYHHVPYSLSAVVGYRYERKL